MEEIPSQVYGITWRLALVLSGCSERLRISSMPCINILADCLPIGLDAAEHFSYSFVLASAGYLIYLLSHSWPFIFAGLAFAMAWHSMASPAIFAVIGDVLPRKRRAMGFTFQSILKRVPMVIPFSRRRFNCGPRHLRRHQGWPCNHARACGYGCSHRAQNRCAGHRRRPGEYKGPVAIISHCAQAAAHLRRLHQDLRRHGRHIRHHLRDERSGCPRRKLRDTGRHTDDYLDPGLHTLGKDCRPRRAQAICDSHLRVLRPFSVGSRSCIRIAIACFGLSSSPGFVKSASLRVRQ